MVEGTQIVFKGPLSPTPRPPGTGDRRTEQEDEEAFAHGMGHRLLLRLGTCRAVFVLSPAWGRGGAGSTERVELTAQLCCAGRQLSCW